MSIVETIDRAIAQYGEHTHPDWETSGDAMRWTPTEEGLPQPRASTQWTWSPPALRPTLTGILAEVYQMYSTLSHRDRHDSVWHISPDVMRRLLAVSTYANGCVPSPRLDGTATLCGMPVVVDPNLPRGQLVIITTQWQGWQHLGYVSESRLG